MIEIPESEFGYAAASKTKVHEYLKLFTRNTLRHTCYTNLGPRPNLLLSSAVFLLKTFVCFGFLFLYNNDIQIKW